MRYRITQKKVPNSNLTRYTLLRYVPKFLFFGTWINVCTTTDKSEANGWIEDGRY